MGSSLSSAAADGGEYGDLGRGREGLVEGERAGFAVDRDRQLRAEVAVLDDAVVEAGASLVERAENVAEGSAINFHA
jgi:hypothetical protein